MSLQRGMSRKGYEWVAREIQRELENHDALTPLTMPPSLDTFVLVQLDIDNCFPNTDRQLAIDMMAGVASKDYVGTAFTKGSQLPSNPVFQSLVPLCHLLYSQPMTLIHHYPGRSLETVEFETGVSQGCTTGSPAAVLPIHFGLHVALSRHPNKLVLALGIIDDISLLGAARDI